MTKKEIQDGIKLTQENIKAIKKAINEPNKLLLMWDNKEVIPLIQTAKVVALLKSALKQQQGLLKSLKAQL